MRRYFALIFYLFIVVSVAYPGNTLDCMQGVWRSTHLSIAEVEEYGDDSVMEGEPGDESDTDGKSSDESDMYNVEVTYRLVRGNEFLEVYFYNGEMSVFSSGNEFLLVNKKYCDAEKRDSIFLISDIQDNNSKSIAFFICGKNHFYGENGTTGGCAAEIWKMGCGEYSMSIYKYDFEKIDTNKLPKDLFDALYDESLSASENFFERIWMLMHV